MTAKKLCHRGAAKGIIFEAEDLFGNYHIEQETVFSRPSVRPPATVVEVCCRELICRLGGIVSKGIGTFQVIREEIVGDRPLARS